ncbi:cell cycle arrest in response to pheromone-related protein [Trichosporon asahii var. asahii CBS 8904]|uniref:Cell cycle arrest in response to pheromone-related protein n=1 Tax=Trichosporon asahii var. asahii (strain CBS 8904) TaxID=1220162 RepID=K1VYJ9_TRIAC|nr:cell cycle arrest in response to pheromone-related protein [Trichosporon asahii var. asahii CBS 8904]
MKMIHLPPGQKIGRQTNNKTVPGERNAYFDSKVLSRTHAEIWEQNGKDVKSSNGTFINGVRLSPEGVESDPYELKSEDMVLANYQNDTHNARRGTSLSNSGAAVNPLSHMGPPIMSAGGKSGLNFDDVLHKLQDALNRSKESGQELQGLTTAMTDVQDTLGGGLNGSASQYIPPQFRNPSAEAQAALAGPHGPQAAAFISLQSQITETQASLNLQLDKIRQLEGQIEQQDALKREISVVREQMEESRREMEGILLRSESLDVNDDDDARSVVTVVPGGDSERPPEEEAHDNNLDQVTKVELSNRIQTLETEMAETVQLSKTLQSQHSEALTTVKDLTDRLGKLESGIAERVTTAVEQAEARWEAWRSKFEERWKQERAAWETERDRLRGIVREWEEASRRAAEEEEERVMNEQLSEDDLADEEDPAEDEVDAAELATMDLADSSPRKTTKSRRRRLSTKTALAVRGLRSVANATGSSTPRGNQPAEGAVTEESSKAALNRLRRSSASAPTTVYNEKDSSESGRESADTLRGEKLQEGDADVNAHRNLPPVS